MYLKAKYALFTDHLVTYSCAYRSAYNFSRNFDEDDDQEFHLLLEGINWAACEGAANLHLDKEASRAEKKANAVS